MLRLFNVTSSFDENLYTTPLDKTTLTRDQKARAERIAAEIESKSSNNIHMREERNMVRCSFVRLPRYPSPARWYYLHTLLWIAVGDV